MYVINPEIIEFLPKQEFFNMDTYKNYFTKKEKISIFPVQESIERY